MEGVINEYKRKELEYTMTLEDIKSDDEFSAYEKKLMNHGNNKSNIC